MDNLLLIKKETLPKQSNYSKAFSLIELMVVITIIGILSAIAIPAYKRYLITSKIASGIPILTKAMKTVILNHQINGTFPNPLSVYDKTINGNTYAALSNSPIVGTYYNSNSVNAWVCVFFQDIGIPGFIANTGNNGTYTRLCMVTNISNGIYKQYCGVWNSTTQTADIPTTYLPSTCNCDYVQNIAINTSSTNCYH